MSSWKTTWKPIKWPFMNWLSHLNANIVIMPLPNDITWLYIKRLYTMTKRTLIVTCVKRSFVILLILKGTSERFMKRSELFVIIVTLQPQRNIWKWNKLFTCTFLVRHFYWHRISTRKCDKRESKEFIPLGRIRIIPIRLAILFLSLSLSKATGTFSSDKLSITQSSE